MSEDASAGRLHVDVVADVSGLRGDLDKKLRTSLAGLKAKVSAQVGFSVTQARTALNTTLAQASTGTRGRAARAQVTFSVSQVRKALNDAIREASSDARTVSVKVDADTAQARAKLAALARTRVRVRVDADVAGATAKIAALRAASSRTVNVPVKISTAEAITAAGRALRTLGRIPFFASGIALAAGAAVNLAAGLFSVASAASQAVGVLGALPGLVVGAAQGVAALVLGFSGISDAVKALDKAQISSGQSAQRSSGQQSAAAEQVRAARERLARAEEDAAERSRQAAVSLARTQEAAAERVQAARERLARAQEDAAEREAAAERRLVEVRIDSAERVRDAERRLSASHDTVRRAQEELNRAAAETVERFEDLELAVRGAALDEQDAVIALEHARRKLADITSPYSLAASDLDRRQAQVDYDQAVLRLDEIRERRGDLASEQAEADRTGVEGSREVLEARRRLEEAAADEAEAARDLAQAQAESTHQIADAQRELSETQRDGLRDVAEAQRDLMRTQRDSAREVADAERELRQARRDGARDVADAQRALATAMRSGSDAVGAQSAAVRNLATSMDRLSPAGRRFAHFIDGVLRPRFYRLRSAVQEALLPPLQRAIAKSLPLLDVLQKGVVGSARVIGDLAGDLAGMGSSPAFKRDVGAVMDSNNRSMRNFGQAGLAVVGILRDLAVVAGPVLIEPFARWTRKVAEAGAETVKTARRTGELRDWLAEAGETAKDLVTIAVNVVRGILNIGKASKPTGKTLLDELVELSERFVRTTSDPANQAAMREYFEQARPVLEQLGKLAKNLLDLLIRLGDVTGGGWLDGFFTVLNLVVDLLERLASIPGAAPVLTALFALAGAAFALGLVARAVGGIAGNLRKVARFTGLSKLFGFLNSKRTGKSAVSGLADDLDKMSGAIDRELPKDRNKSRAIGDIGDKADTTKRKSGDLGRGFDDLGKRADTGAKKSRGLAKALKGIGDRAKDTGGILSGLASPATGKHTKKAKKAKKGTGKLKTAGKGAGVVAGLGTLLFGDDILEMLGIDANSVAGQATQGAISGGELGSVLGAPGAAVGSLLGAASGPVESRGGNKTGALIGSIFGLPGLLIGGWGDQIKAKLGAKLGEVTGQLKIFATTVPRIMGSAWDAAVKTVPGLSVITGAVSGIMSRVGTTFADLRTRAPELLRVGWQTVLTTIPVLRPLSDLVGGVVSGAGEKFADLRARAPELLRVGWQTVLTTVPALRPLSDLVGKVTSGAGEKFATLRTRAPELLQSGWKTALGTIPGLRPLTDKIGEITDGGRRRFEELKTKAPQLLTTGWRGVLATIPGLRPLGTEVKKITDSVVGWFKSGVSGVQTNWGRLPSVTGGPIRTVVNTVFNQGLVKVWNAVAGKIPGFATLPTIKLGFARGGILPGFSRWRNGDDQLVPLRRGEGIYVSEAMSDPYERARLFAVNAAAMAGRPLTPYQGAGFAEGGIFDGVKAFALAAKDFFAGGLKKTLSAAVGPLLANVTAALGGSPYGRLIAGAAKTLVGGLTTRILGLEDKIAGGGATGVVKAARTYIGTPYVWGGTSHGGIDCSGLTMRAWLEGAKKNISRTTYTQRNFMKTIAGPRPGAVGQPHSGHTYLASRVQGGRTFVVEARQSGTRVSEHLLTRPTPWWGWPPGVAGMAAGGIAGLARKVADSPMMRDLAEQFIRRGNRESMPAKLLGLAGDPGGVLPGFGGPAVRDRGGPLRPGINVIRNGTRAMEWVLTPEAVALLGGPRAVQDLNDHARVYRARAGATTAAASPSPAAAATQPTVIVNPQPGQSEHEIGMVAARKIGQMLR